jgi:hypothetical protein
MKLARIFFTAVALLPLYGFGNCHRWAFDAEFLYFSTLVNGNYFAVAENDPIVTAAGGRRLTNVGGFDPGFRLGVGYNLSDCSELHARFTFYDGDHSQTFNNGPGGIILPSISLAIDEITSDLHLRYYSGDFTYHYSLFHCCPLKAQLFGGFNYTWFRFREDLDAFATGLTVDARQRSFFWGFGPEFGLDLSYGVWDALALVSNLRAGALISEIHADSRLFRSTVPTDTIMTNEPDWKVTPFIDARVGLNYGCLLSGFNFTIEAGYEFIWYSNAIFTTPEFALAADDNLVRLNDLSLHGPYIALAFNY